MDCENGRRHDGALDAATPRNRDWEVTARTSYGNIPGASLVDWPIEYEELKNYYQLAEKRLGVTRRNGVPGMPASNNFKVMYAGAKKLGYKRVHTAYMAINSRAWDGRAFCIQQGFCVQGCKTGAKWSTLYTEIPRAEATGNLDLRIECMATRIEHGADGRVTGSSTSDAKGQEQRQKARVVCVAGNAIETPAPVAACRSPQFPQVSRIRRPGRAQLPHHIIGFVWGVFASRSIPGVARRSRASSRTRRQRAEARLRRRLPHRTVRARSAHFSVVGMPYGWGRDFASIIENYRNIAGMFINGEDMPRAENRITFDPKSQGRSRLPVAHVHVDEHANDQAMRKHAHGAGRSDLRGDRREARRS